MKQHNIKSETAAAMEIRPPWDAQRLGPLVDQIKLNKPPPPCCTAFYRAGGDKARQRYFKALRLHLPSCPGHEEERQAWERQQGEKVRRREVWVAGVARELHVTLTARALS